MPKSKYYKILGLPNNSSLKEVKKHYRSLVMKYHPDRNPDPKAHELFVKITEAYHIILDENFHPKPHSKSTSNKTKEEKAKEREERLKKARERYKQQKTREKIENILYYKKLTSGKKWKQLKIIAIISFFTSVLLVADLFLPHHTNEKKIESHAFLVALDNDDNHIGSIKTTDHSVYYVKKMDYNLYGETKYVDIESSWIFNSPIFLISKNKTKLTYYELSFTLYNSIGIIAFMLLLPIFTLWYKRMNILFTIIFHLSYYGISGLLILIALTRIF